MNNVIGKTNNLESVKAEITRIVTEHCPEGANKDDIAKFALGIANHFASVRFARDTESGRQIDANVCFAFDRESGYQEDEAGNIWAQYTLRVQVGWPLPHPLHRTPADSMAFAQLVSDLAILGAEVEILRDTEIWSIDMTAEKNAENQARVHARVFEQQVNSKVFEVTKGMRRLTTRTFDVAELWPLGSVKVVDPVKRTVRQGNRTFEISLDPTKLVVNRVA